MPPIPFYRPLGRTQLNVSCLGIGGGAAVPSDDVLYAFDRGINFFFFSSDLHHFIYQRMAKALRTLCGAGSAQRSRVVLAMISYIRQPALLESILFDQFAELGIDYIDVFMWGWLHDRDRPVLPSLLSSASYLRGPGSGAQQRLEETFGVSKRMQEMGAVRYVGMSFHDIGLAAEVVGTSAMDVVMVRHNFAHRKAQELLFLPLSSSADPRPGVITFNSTHGTSGPLWQWPHSIQPEVHLPRPETCYRYALSQPNVDLCLSGPRNRAQIDAALEAIEAGTLTRDELRFLDLYGDVHRGLRPIQDLNTFTSGWPDPSLAKESP